MRRIPEDNWHEEDIQLAGHRTAPGRYRELGTGRTIELEEEGRLPASLDGRVACYIRIANTWGQYVSQRNEPSTQA